mmetsp:Transcript_21521/g.37034  ORF Transcript_21521/g.37034 Transcript_21521/m.37034 type:complete len:131 (+) Transcript_21521:1088-1480(+)
MVQAHPQRHYRLCIKIQRIPAALATPPDLDCRSRQLRDELGVSHVKEYLLNLFVAHYRVAKSSRFRVFVSLLGSFLAFWGIPELDRNRFDNELKQSIRTLQKEKASLHETEARVAKVKKVSMKNPSPSFA